MTEIPLGIWIFLGILVTGILAICIAVMYKPGQETATDIMKAAQNLKIKKIIAASGSAVLFDNGNSLDDNNAVVNNQQPPSTTVGPNRLTDEALKLILQYRTIVGRKEDADGPA